MGRETMARNPHGVLSSEASSGCWHLWAGGALGLQGKGTCSVRETGEDPENHQRGSDYSRLLVPF